MTIIQAITQARSVKPNQYDDEMMVAWLSELDGMIYHEYMAWHAGAHNETDFVPYDAESDMDKTLLVTSPYDGIYVKYLCAQVDYYNGETNRYTNSMVMFNTALSAFSDWYNRTYMPKQNNYVQV